MAQYKMLLLSFSQSKVTSVLYQWHKTSNLQTIKDSIRTRLVQSAAAFGNVLQTFLINPGQLDLPCMPVGMTLAHVSLSK